LDLCGKLPTDPQVVTNGVVDPFELSEELLADLV
jgi:hypothetical protein